MYQVSSTNAETLVVTAKFALKHVNLLITKLCGQCYDGAASIRGMISGIAFSTKNPEQHIAIVTAA